ncbi:MAG: hypothetical protein QXY94_06585 [Archaeoglobaceae archaeon]
MGVMHFAGLGRSPGAVTSGLSYLKNEMASSFKEGNIIEAVVVFTSEEIASGKEEAFPCEYNEYCQTQRSKYHRVVANRTNAVEIVKEFLKQELSDTEFYLVKIDTSDFSKCLEAVAKALLKFHPPGKVGKHIWVNLTGGTNILNAALIQVAYLSGLIPKLYYTFVANPRENGKYLQPFSKDSKEFDYREIYVIPTTFDERYRHLLEELSELEELSKLSKVEEWITAQDLLSRLKSRTTLFDNLNVETFIRNYLNVWPGIERKGSRQTGQENAVKLSDEGRRLRDLLKERWFDALLRRSTLSESDKDWKEIVGSLEIQRLLPA